MRRLADLWAGRLPLGEAFWIWAVGVGLALNVTASAAMLGMLAVDLPGALALAIHLAPAPYNVAVAIAVWRSAAAYEGPPGNAAAARVAVLAWAAFLMLI